MNKDEKLIYIANAINAANKIQNIYNSNYKDSSRSSVKPSDVDFIKKILDIMTESLPGPRKDKLSKTVNRCYECCNVYRNTKNHMVSSSNKVPNISDIYKILNQLKPAAGNRQKYYIEKLIKLYELFN